MPDLGYKPAIGFDVNLGRGCDFVQTLTRKDGADWPDGTTLALVIGDHDAPVATWPATLDGPDVRWQVDKAQVNTLAVAGFQQALPVRAVYTDAAGLDLVWFTGRTRWYA